MGLFTSKCSSQTLAENSRGGMLGTRREISFGGSVDIVVNTDIYSNQCLHHC